MIELVNITKRYGSIVANYQVSLKVDKGELLTLLGPSGCGKTTTLRCITGHCPPDEGQVFIEGKNVTTVPPHKREVAMVFQNFALFPHMTVFENVNFPLKIKSIPANLAAEKIKEILKLVRLTGYEHHYPRQLSGGQQQRVGLARALVYRPKVLLLDEPLSNLDAKLREEMRFEIKELQTKLGITALYVTHDQEEALALSDRLAIMKDGKIHQIGTPEQIFEQPKTKFVATFIGLSNFIEGRVKLNKPVVLDIGANAELIIVPLEQVKIGEKILIFIRPNDVELVPERKIELPNTFDGVIKRVTYLGDKIDYLVELNRKLEIRVQTKAALRFKKGESVRVHLPVEKCKILKTMN